MKFVLVIDRKLLFPGLSPQGFLPLDTIDLDVVDRHGFFAERDYMERCSHFKQLIPYVALTLGDRVLAYQRQAKHSEARLGGLWTVGFGGHIEPMDRSDAPGGLLHAAGLRELEEETGFTVASDALVERGCINSEAEDVSSVHVGVFFTVSLDATGLDAGEIAEKVTAQAEPYRVQWLDRRELDPLHAPQDGAWEDWTRIVLPVLGG
jgi:predicted NUDIX family phosphoesterase